MEQKRIAFHTIGCKLNFAETSSVASQLDDGFEVVDFRSEADVYVIQSCVVTAMAEKKCRAAIRKAAKQNPNAMVTVLGCMSQVRAAELAAMPEVSLVLGNAEKHRLRDYLKSKHIEQSVEVAVSDILNINEFVHASSTDDRTRMFFKIQDGCDYFCSYCAVPLARGTSRSNRIATTMTELKNAVEKYNPKEVVLSGVNLGDFGRKNNETLFELLKEIVYAGLFDRLRLSSIEPDLLTDEIIELVATSKKIMPHFHLPLQSGSDNVLRRMKRRYDTGLFIERVENIKRNIPHACIAVDVITGFPGETENDYKETYSLLSNLPVSYLHVFPYSERPGTLAETLKPKVSQDSKSERSQQLLSLSDRKLDMFYTQNVGRTEKVLFESQALDHHLYGFTTNYIKVKTSFSDNLQNQIADVKLKLRDDQGCFIFQNTLI